MEAQEHWLTYAAAAISQGRLIKLSLAAPRDGEPGLRRLRIRPVTLRAGPRFQWVWEYDARDVTKNLDAAETMTLLRELVGRPFRSAHLAAVDQTVELSLVGKKPNLKVTVAAADAADTRHDRAKVRTLDSRSPWLRALGVTTAEGRVCHGMEPKFRQIHRFVEILNPLAESAGLTEEGDGRPLQVVDMGCGKGYLTFAAHQHLRAKLARPVATLGIEARAPLVAAANQAAAAAGCEGLRFLAGTIAESSVAAPDILVALHACDTATDDALAAGVAAGAALLLAAPCCHREVRPQLSGPPELAGALRHGIFRERQAEFVTDALRAALLEASGYETRVFEFVSPEHTAKNVMIAALKRASPERKETALKAARELARLYGVRRQRLAERLGLNLEFV